MKEEAERLTILRNRLEESLLAGLEEVYVNGHRERRLPHVSNLSFRYVDAEGLMMTFNQQLAVASGSACTSASLEPSHVLRAMGLGDDLSQSAIRFSLGRFTTEAEIDTAIQAVTNGVKHLRSLSPVWEMFKEGMLE